MLKIYFHRTPEGDHYGGQFGGVPISVREIETNKIAEINAFFEITLDNNSKNVLADFETVIGDAFINILHPLTGKTYEYNNSVGKCEFLLGNGLLTEADLINKLRWVYAKLMEKELKGNSNTTP